MTVLDRQEILRRVRARDLVISPILSEKQLGVSSVDLRMGNIFLSVRARGLSHVDPQAYTARPDVLETVVERRQKHERHEITFDQHYLLHPGSLALVPTLEWFQLPLDLQGLVTARSSWAREGLSIATASFVEPGYEGVITLELANLGQIPIALYPGLRIAQIAFYKLEQAAVRRADEESQFQMSFEPTEGNIARHDEAFVPPPAARP